MCMHKMADKLYTALQQVRAACETLRPGSRTDLRQPTPLPFPFPPYSTPTSGRSVTRT
jgi:hypothetical protein